MFLNKHESIDTHKSCRFLFMLSGGENKGIFMHCNFRILQIKCLPANKKKIVSKIEKCDELSLFMVHEYRDLKIF